MDRFQIDEEEVIQLTNTIRSCNIYTTDILKSSANINRSKYLHFVVDISSEVIAKNMIFEYLHTLQPFMFAYCTNILDERCEESGQAYIFVYPAGNQCIQIKCVTKDWLYYGISFSPSSLNLAQFIKHKGFNNTLVFDTDIWLFFISKAICLTDFETLDIQGNTKCYSIDMHEFSTKYTEECLKILDSKFKTLFDASSLLRGKTKIELLTLLSLEDENLNEFGKVLRNSLPDEMKNRNIDTINDKYLEDKVSSLKLLDDTKERED